MDEICAQGAAQIRKKKIYDVTYQIEAEKVRRAKASLLEYKRRIEHARLDVQAQYLELYRRDEEGETCPNCGVKRIKLRTRPRLPF